MAPISHFPRDLSGKGCEELTVILPPPRQEIGSNPFFAFFVASWFVPIFAVSI